MALMPTLNLPYLGTNKDFGNSPFVRIVFKEKFHAPFGNSVPLGWQEPTPQQDVREDEEAHLLLFVPPRTKPP